MTILLFALLLVILFFPLIFRKVEENLEAFLFIVGILTLIVSSSFNLHFFLEVLGNPFIYMITMAVLIGGFIFKYINKHIEKTIKNILNHIPLRIFICIIIIIIGLISSVITAIIASLLLVEIIEMLPISRKNKIKVTILACFSIGLGAVLTPIGEPLSTIIVTKLDIGFWYLFNSLGIYIIPAIIALGLLGTYFGVEFNAPDDNMKLEIEKQSNSEIIMRAIKIFIFVMALDMLGAGFKPLVDNYIVHLDSSLLYWINMSSAVLDNATLAAAEISTKMTAEQINVVIMGLLISGGMMIPGNIPNIISAQKLKIKSSEWIRFAIPLGLIIMIIYYVILFFL
jgi:predicted cation transporter